MRISELSYNDLQRLRAAVFRAHLRYYPTELLTNREADRVIETLLPGTVERMLKKLVDGKMTDGKLAG